MNRLWLFGFLLAAGCVQADVLNITVSFKNSVPFTGIVYVPEEKVPDINAVLDQKDKQFSAPLVTVSPGGKLRLRNSDDFNHNIFADDKATGLAFDLGMIEPKGSFRLPVRWQADSMVRLGCKIHPTMKAYVANVHSRYYTMLPLSAATKTYEARIARVPADLTEVRALFPNVSMLSVKVAAGQSRTLPIAYNGNVVGEIKIDRQGD